MMDELNLSTIPIEPGVYFFRSAQGKILYIGKAANLRTRLRSYFRTSANLDSAKRKMLEEARRVTCTTTDSPIEALILEAKLIKEKQPPYNVHLRDDKRYFFIGFTREDCSRVFVTHQPTAPGVATDFVGPFTDGVAIKRTLKLLRRVFPYRTHKGLPRTCLQYDMGLCPIPSGIVPPSKKTVLACRRNIRAIKQVLEGDADKLIKRLEREMRRASRDEDFELARKRRDEVSGLLRVLDHRNVLTDEQRHDITVDDIPATIRRLMRGQTPHKDGRGETSTIQRIEGYDIANLQDGKAATGSMVVFTNGVPVSDEYKQCRIKTVKGSNDVKMIAEVLSRRVRHTDWREPDLIVIDGGKPQLNAALAALKNSRWDRGSRPIEVQPQGSPRLDLSGPSGPLVLALAKRDEEIYLPGRSKPLKLKKSHPFLLLLMHVRDEAHRFARRYHHRLRDYR